MIRLYLCACAVLLTTFSVHAVPPISISWENEYLTIRHRALPNKPVMIHYLEAFCRPGSTDHDWNETVITNKITRLTSRYAGEVRLQQVLADGVVVHHVIAPVADGVNFTISAYNPTDEVSQAQWAQPCMRVDCFVGLPMQKSGEHYLPQCFLFLNKKLTRMPMLEWAKQAWYTPGQVWCPLDVNRDDVNPRPFSSQVPLNVLIGCFSRDDRWVLAMAWEPYQELFQGVITCLHSDFRIGGLLFRERKQIRGKVYLFRGKDKALLERYQKQFPEHHEH